MRAFRFSIDRPVGEFIDGNIKVAPMSLLIKQKNWSNRDIKVIRKQIVERTSGKLTPLDIHTQFNQIRRDNILAELTDAHANELKAFDRDWVCETVDRGRNWTQKTVYTDRGLYAVYYWKSMFNSIYSRTDRLYVSKVRHLRDNKFLFSRTALSAPSPIEILTLSLKAKK